MQFRWLFLATVILLLGSCSSIPKQIDPKIPFTLDEQYLQALPPPFADLSTEELRTDWGKEYLIGLKFARSLDLYRAITAFRRAEFLIPLQQNKRLLEIEYQILLSYYLGGRYFDVERTFSRSHLASVTADFPPFHDLLVILYDTFLELKDPKRASQALDLLKERFPKTYQDLLLSTAFREANLDKLRESLKDFVTAYQNQKKSPTTAATLNAILPGAGYFYLGQKQTAFTAFVFNGLFIAASIYFFLHGNIPAGIIALGFEAGWYFGGIYGAGREAKFYNERLYERLAQPLIYRERLLPILLLKNGF